jgi:hypothetical protein
MITQNNDNERVPAEESTEHQDPKALRLAAERKDILAAVANVELTTLQKRVAWLLNHIPETRDSDIALQLKYWETFESEIYQGIIYPDDLFRLTRLTSLSRSRATIQNSQGLFLASEAVRRHRGTLETEERTAQREARAAAAAHSYTVYVDESGKTGEYLIVGSCWLLNGIESLRIAQDLIAWRDEQNFHEELHFSKLGRGSLPFYLEALNILYRKAPALGFKAVSLPRRGIRDVDGALTDMLYHLVVRGISHESDSGRAPLPRTIQIWKDLENEAQDQLALANFRDRLAQAAQSQFDGRLHIGDVFSVESHASPFLQFTDLFVSSINRVLMSPNSDNSHPKDVFARELLTRFGAARVNPELGSATDFVFFDDI